MEFVTFEIAKKLKEKGFNVPCIYAYCEQGGWNKYTQKREPITYILRTDANPFGTYYTGKNWNKEYETNKNKIQCSAPTISQVLKWLRDEKKLHVRASIYFIGWCVDVTNMDGKRIYSTECEYYNYEQAAIAGIKYVLDNLI
jgi:hypothetical protein